MAPSSQPAAASQSIPRKAAASVLVQLQRGSRESARRLYYGAHSLLRALRLHLGRVA